MICPAPMPMREGTIASEESARLSRRQASREARPAANAMVETAKDRPSAWTRSSLSGPSAWR
jgi:hypothetical protein